MVKDALSAVAATSPSLSTSVRPSSPRCPPNISAFHPWARKQRQVFHFARNNATYSSSSLYFFQGGDGATG